MEKIMKYTLIGAFVVCVTYMVYVHRRVIRAWIKGEELPKPPKGHCHGVCKNR